MLRLASIMSIRIRCVKHTKSIWLPIYFKQTWNLKLNKATTEPLKRNQSLTCTKRNCWNQSCIGSIALHRADIASMISYPIANGCPGHEPSRKGTFIVTLSDMWQAVNLHCELWGTNMNESLQFRPISMACAQFKILLLVLQHATVAIYMRHVGDIHNLLQCLGPLLLNQHQGNDSQNGGSD